MFGRDAVRAMNRDADTTAHGNAVENGEIGLGEALDLNVQPVFDGEKRLAGLAIAAAAFGDHADIAAGAETARTLGMVEHQHLDGRVRSPVGEGIAHHGAHLCR